MADLSKQTNKPSALRKTFTVIFFAATLIAAAVASWWALRPAPPLTPLSPVTIAVPTQINSAPLIIASSKGLFREAGVAVTNQPFTLGIDALNSLLAGKSDLAVVADVPTMFSLVRGDDIAILAGISQARRTLAVVARRDRDIHAVKDLAGKTVGLTLGTNLGYFLDALLQANDTPSSSVRLQNMKTNETLDALQAGKIDAAVVFQPNLARLQAQMGEQLSVFYGEDVYAFRFLLVGSAPYIDAHPQEIQRILNALVAANRFIRKDPVAARGIVGRAVQVADETMAKIFDTNDYDISLNQAMLLALEDETRWAMQNSLVKPAPMPDYLSRMKYQALEAVKPEAVRIVR